MKYRTLEYSEVVVRRVTRELPTDGVSKVDATPPELCDAVYGTILALLGAKNCSWMDAVSDSLPVVEAGGNWYSRNPEDFSHQLREFIASWHVSIINKHRKNGARTVRRPKFSEMIEPRLLTEEETAHYLGMSVASFSEKKRQFEAKYNFPRQNPLLGRRDRKAIDLWLDRNFGLSDGQNNVEALINERLGALRNGKSENSVL